MSLKTYINPDAIAGDSIDNSKITNFKSDGYIDLHRHTLTIGEFLENDEGGIIKGEAYIGVGVKIGTDIIDNDIKIYQNVVIYKGVQIGTDKADNSKNNIYIGPDVKIENVNIGSSNIGRVTLNGAIIGDKVLIHNNVIIGTNERYYDGTKTQIGQDVYICDCVIGTYHNNSDSGRSVKISRNVTIGDIGSPGGGVSIGSNVNIDGGVNINYPFTISRNSRDYVCFSWGSGSTSKTVYVNSLNQTTFTGDTNLSITKSLSPNIYYVINNVANANISFKSELSGIMNNYMFQIEVVSPLEGSNISIKLPETIKWANGNVPNFEAGKIYQISVINNLGVFTEF